MTSLSHQNAQEILNFQLFILKTGLWALAFLAFFTSSFWYPVKPFVCVACGMLGSIGLGSFEPWSGFTLFIVRARYFPISLGDYSYFSPDSHDASRKKYLPTTSRNSYGVTSEPQVTATEGSFGGSSFEQIPNFVAAPDLSDEKPPLEQKWLLNTKSTKRIKIREFHASNYRH